MAYVKSPNYYSGRVAPIRVVVIHDGETDETGSAAEGMANWFSRPTTRASAHLCVDTDSTVRCVDDQDTAWAAPGANADGLQIELAGRASQSTSQWNDAASSAILHRAANEVATWCKRWNIPIRWLTDAQLADGVTKGLTTHLQVSRVFKLSDHSDPGVGFPAGAFLALVNQAAGYTPKPTPAPTKPANVTVPPFPGILRVGSRGSGVITLQKRLAQRGWKIGVDGIFGSQTQAIVRQFQAEKHLAVDGIVGPVTWRKLWTAPIT